MINKLRIFIGAITIFISGFVSAIPTIAIPNLVYTDVEVVTKISKQVQKDLPVFNAAIRGAIISSKQFKVVTIKEESKTLSDYTLLGQVVAIAENEDLNPVKNTDKTTKQYNIDITVDYTLINTQDDSIMASFTANGQASDTKILTNNNLHQVQKHNIPLLIKSVSNNLAKDIVQQLEEQIKISRLTYDNESKIITDVKIYSD